MPKAITRPNMYAPKKARSMGDMNVTPFIDVLLVLLIMLILAIPVQVHQTTVDLPTGPIDRTEFPILAENTIHITQDDTLLWNGAEVTREQLSSQVAAASGQEDEPLLRFEPDALASYDASARTITLIKDAGATRFTFVGNERYRNWD